MRLENIKFETKVKKKLVLLEDWSTWSMTLTLQKDSIDFSHEIPCFSYLKEARNIETYLTFQFKCKPSCTKITGITDLHLNRHTREE